MHDHHDEGLFPIETWERTLRSVGFEVRQTRREAEGIAGSGHCTLGFLGIQPAGAADTAG